MMVVFLADITTVCILEGFQNQASLQIADRVLKEQGKSRARLAYQVCLCVSICIFVYVHWCLYVPACIFEYM